MAEITTEEIIEPAGVVEVEQELTRQTEERATTQALSIPGFENVKYTDITKYTIRSSRRLMRFYYLASVYLLWKKISFSNGPSIMQKKNIAACKFQYQGMKKGLWQYGLIVGKKP